jgi:hypothetical protein
MTEVIFDELTAARDAAIRDGEQLAHHARAFLAGHLHHKEGTTVSISEDIKSDLTDGISYIEGWVARVKAAAPGIVADAQRFADSPVTQALEKAGALIDPAAEQVIAGWISDLAALRAQAPAVPVAAAEPDPLPAQ